MTDGLPAFDGTTSSEIFAKHLIALHDSRRAYIQTESNERIRRAWRGKVRATDEMKEETWFTINVKERNDSLVQLL